MQSEPRYSQLDYRERQTIAISLKQVLSMRAIGRVLNRSAATISREIARNSGRHGYSCRYAQQRRVRRRCHSRARPKLVAGNGLCLNPSPGFFASAGRPSKLQRTWLNCIPMRPLNVPRMKPSATLSTPNPAASCAKSSWPACAWHAPSAGRSLREQIAGARWPIY